MSAFSLADRRQSRAQPVEIVERKGLGHPDTVCDALAEEVSLALSRFYLERFRDFVLHHNVDKVLLRGGAARPAFAGGEVDEPIELYLAGRATREFGGARIPVDELAVNACRAMARRPPVCARCRAPRADPLLVPARAPATSSICSSGSAGARHGWRTTPRSARASRPTPLETAVLAAERSLQERAAPERGEDVKVMGSAPGALHSDGRLCLCRWALGRPGCVPGRATSGC